MNRNYFKATGSYVGHVINKIEGIEWLIVTMDTMHGELSVDIPVAESEGMIRASGMENWNAGQIITATGHIFLLAEGNIQLIAKELSETQEKECHLIAEYGIFAQLIDKHLVTEEGAVWLNVQTMFRQHEWNAPQAELMDFDDGDLMVFGSKLKPENFESGININDAVLMKGTLSRSGFDDKLFLQEYTGERVDGDVDKIHINNPM